MRWLEDSLVRRGWYKRLHEISNAQNATIEEVRESMQMLSCPVELATDDDLKQAMQKFEIASKQCWDKKLTLQNMSMYLSDLLSHREEQRKIAILDSLPPGTPRRCDAAGLEHKWWHVSEGETLELPKPLLFCSTGMEFPPTDWTRRMCHRCGVQQQVVQTDGMYAEYEWEEIR